jgi:hypothetical protein
VLEKNHSKKFEKGETFFFIYVFYSAAVVRHPKTVSKNKKNMFSIISALGIARQHSKVSHDSNNSKSPVITKFDHFGYQRPPCHNQLLCN